MNNKNRQLLQQLFQRSFTPPTGAPVDGSPQPQPQFSNREKLSQMLGGDTQGMGKRAMLKQLSANAGITDPTGGRFKNREMLQGLLAQRPQTPAGQPEPAQVAPVNGGSTLPPSAPEITVGTPPPMPTAPTTIPQAPAPVAPMGGGNTRPKIVPGRPLV